MNSRVDLIKIANTWYLCSYKRNRLGSWFRVWETNEEGCYLDNPNLLADIRNNHWNGHIKLDSIFKDMYDISEIWSMADILMLWRRYEECNNEIKDTIKII